MVPRSGLPASTAPPGDDLEMPIALRRCGLGGPARHRAGARRHNDRGIWMTLSHSAVNVVPVEGPIGREGRNGTLDLVEQGTNLGAVIDLRPGELGREDLARVGIHADVERL